MSSMKTVANSGWLPKTWQRSWAGAVLLTAITALSARFAVYIPPTPVPVTLQVFAVLLTGLCLHRRWAVLAQLQYLVIGALGVPIFARGGFGTASLFGLTGGYLLSYPIAAYVAAWIVERPADGEVTLPRQIAACAAGLGVIYGLGCGWYAAFAHLSLLNVILPGAAIFLAWDCVKAMAAIAIARGAAACNSRLGS